MRESLWPPHEAPPGVEKCSGCAHFSHVEPCVEVVTVEPSKTKPGYWRRNLCGCTTLVKLMDGK